MSKVKLAIDWSNIKILVLDCDGVFINNTEVEINNLVKHAYNYVGRVPYKTLQKNWGASMSHIWKVIQESTRANNVEMSLLKSKYREDFENYQLNSNLFRIFERLNSSSCSIGLITDRSHTEWYYLSQKLNFKTSIFTFVQTSTDYNYQKPDGQIFSPVIARARWVGYKPEQIIYIGDTVDYDYAAIVNSRTSINFLGVASGASTYDDFLKSGLPPEHIISSFDDLPRFLVQSFQLNFEWAQPGKHRPHG